MDEFIWINPKHNGALGQVWHEACTEPRPGFVLYARVTSLAEAEMKEAEDELPPWIMFTKDSFYPIQPSPKCKPEDHGALNPHVVRIETAEGIVLWSRQSAEDTP